MRRSTLPVVALLLVLAVGATLALVLFFDRVEHLSLVILIPLMGGLAAAPIVVRLIRGNLDVFEIWIWYSLMFFLFYGVGAVLTLFVEGVAYDKQVLPYLDTAVFYCTIGLACCLLGYRAADRFVKPLTDGPGARIGWLSLAILYTVGLFGQLLFAQYDVPVFKISTIISGLTSFFSQLSFLATFSMFYAFYLFMAKLASPGIRILLFGYMIPSTLYTLVLSVGNKSNLILIVGTPFIAYWYARRKLAWKSLLAFALIVVFIVFPVYYTYRGVRGVYYSERYRIERTVGILQKQQLGEYASGALASVARRLAIINSAAVVVRDTGKRVDYQYGKTLWLGVLAVFIPRFLWPGKPNMTIGIWFGKLFHITGFGISSFVSIGMVAELYWNFDIPGIVVGMVIMGIYLRGLYLRMGINGGRNPARLAMYVTLMYATAMQAEGAIGGFEGAVTKQALVLLALEKLFFIMESSARRYREVDAPHTTTAALMAR